MDGTSSSKESFSNQIIPFIGIKEGDPRLGEIELTNEELGLLEFLQRIRGKFSDFIKKNQSQVMRKEGKEGRTQESQNDKFSEELDEILRNGSIMSILRDKNGILCINFGNENDVDPDNPSKFKESLFSDGNSNVFSASISITRNEPPLPEATRRYKDGVHRAAFGGRIVIVFSLKRVFLGEDNKIKFDPLYSFEVKFTDDSLNQAEVKPRKFITYTQ